MKLLSWNVNGLRSVLGKGFLDYMTSSDADVICLQETKCHPGDVQHVSWATGYMPIWNSAAKKGYSGTVVFARGVPLTSSFGFGTEFHNDEGRAITVEFPGFYLVNVYVPNAQPELVRLGYRQKWDADFLSYLQLLEKSKPVVFCGDLNVAHEDIDLARPKENRGQTRFQR